MKSPARIILSCIAACAFALSAAHATAADIVVQSATPSSAEQGTVGLLVTIKGSNFPRNLTVKFCVTGTDCTTSNVTVKSVKSKGSSAIETVIDVAVDNAILDKAFDIEVIESSTGRKGRGTGLFTVLKTNNGTPQPPEPVVIDRVDSIESAISIAWPVAASPDVSDSVSAFDIRYGTSPISAANFEMATPVPEGLLNAGSVGTTSTLSIRDLQPRVTYYVAVRAVSSKGQVSDLGPASVVAVQTLPTYPTSHVPTWVSETVESIVEYPGSGFGPCCRLEKLDFDVNGNPGVAYQVPGSNEVAPAVRYAARSPSGSGWVLENALNGSVNGISDLRFAPGFADAGLQAGAASLLVTQTVRTLVRKNQYTNQTIRSFLLRTAAGTWTSEAIPFALPPEPELEYFLDGAAWKPATLLVEQVTLPDNTSVPKVSLIARQPGSGGAQWTKDVVLDCTSFPGTAGVAQMLRESDGALDVMVSLSADSGAWLLVAHRDGAASWSYRRTGLTPRAQMQGGLGDGRYAMDATGQLYAVAEVGLYPASSGLNDVVLFEGMQLEDLPVGQAPCSAPQVPFVGTRTVIDHGGSADLYAPGNQDGSIVGTLPWLNGISGFALEYVDGADHPAVHVMYERDDGWHRIREQRVLSRCGGPGADWYRDAVDRAYGDTQSRAVFSYGPEFGIAWAHHVGRHGRQTNFTSYEERMLYTHRYGSVCSAP